MASIQKRGKKWVAEVRVKKQYASKSFDSKNRARAWADAKEAEFKGEVHQTAVVRDTFERYRDEVSPTKKGARWEVIRLNKFCTYPIANILLRELTAEDIIDWRDRRLREVSPATVLREMELMQTAFDQARKNWKWIRENPFKDVDKPRKPPPRDRRITDAEIRLILEALGYEKDGEVTTQRHEIAVGFLLAIETAMRQGELWGLEWPHIHFEEKYAQLYDTKNGYDRKVPLSKSAINLLGKLGPKDSGKVFSHPQGSCGQIYRRTVKMAGIVDLTFHDTRHEALTRMAKKVSMLALARIAGHRDPRNLMIYYNETATELAGLLD